MSTVTSEASTIEARLEKISARLGELEDREAIRDVLHRYARGADRCDLELFKSCYWPDGTDCHWFFNGNAHDFCDYVIPLLAEISNSQHSITNPIIEFHGDRAFVECQWYVLHHMELDDGSGRWLDQQCEGRYVDVFERRDGVWKILHRQVVTESARELVVDATIDAEFPADLPIQGKRAPHDVVYRGMSILDDEIIPIGGMDLWGDARARHADPGH